MATSAPSMSRDVLERAKAPAKSGKSASCTASEHADPRVRRTRKLLQDAYRALIHEKPFSEISVQHIADRATVNRATFYAHYNDKQDLAISVVKADLMTSIYEAFKQRPAVTRQNLVLLSVTVFEFLGNLFDGCPKDGQSLHDSLSLAIQDELYSMVYTWVGYGRAYLDLFPNSNHEAVATVISSSLYGAAYRWVRGGRLQAADEVSREVVAVLVSQ
jgi:AcrR family transcriptional regulator